MLAGSDVQSGTGITSETPRRSVLHILSPSPRKSATMLTAGKSKGRMGGCSWYSPVNFPGDWKISKVFKGQREASLVFQSSYL